MSDFFLKAKQRDREWERGIYFSTIDVIDNLEGQQTTLSEIRTATVNGYRELYPKVFEHFDQMVGELSQQTQILSDQTEILSDQRIILDDQRSLLADQLSVSREIHHELEGIRNTLDIGFDRICVRLDASNKYLSKIEEILSNPTRTQSLEYVRRGSKSLQFGWYDEALTDLAKVVELDPFNYAAWYHIGVVEMEKKGHTEQAIAAFKNCERFSKPENAEYYSRSTIYLAFLALAAGNEQGALELARTANKAYPQNKQATFFLAERMAATKKFEEAEALLGACEEADVMFFLKSLNSFALFKSGVHTRVFDKATAELIEVNKRTLEKVREFKATVTAHLTPEIETGVRKRLADMLVVAETAAQQADYLSARMGHDLVSKEIDGMKNVIEGLITSAQGDLIELNNSSQRHALLKPLSPEVRNATGDDFYTLALWLGIPVWYLSAFVLFFLLSFFTGERWLEENGSFILVPLTIAGGWLWFIFAPEILKELSRMVKQSKLDSKQRVRTLQYQDDFNAWSEKSGDLKNKNSEISKKILELQSSIYQLKCGRRDSKAADLQPTS